MHLRLLNLVLQAGSLAIVLLVVGIGWREGRIQSQMRQTEIGPILGCGVQTPKKHTRVNAFGGIQAEGKQLWNENACGTCHVKNMKTDGTGPALGGVTERWADYPRKDMYEWIRGSQAMIEAEHPRAVELWKDWGPTVMQNYPGLSDEEVEHLLAYIEGMNFSI